MQFDLVNRRKFIAVFGSAAAAWPFVVHGQGERMRRVVFLHAFAENDPEVVERATGHKVIVSFEAAPSLMQKVNAGAPADLVTHYRDVIDDLIKQGKVVGSRVDFARAGVGIAVKAGAPKPDIGTPEAFRHAMLAAKSISYSTGASGIIAAKLMERMRTGMPNRATASVGVDALDRPGGGTDNTADVLLWQHF